MNGVYFLIKEKSELNENLKKLCPLPRIQVSAAPLPPLTEGLSNYFIESFAFRHVITSQAYGEFQTSTIEENKNKPPRFDLVKYL